MGVWRKEREREREGGGGVSQTFGDMEQQHVNNNT
jgi:hypothetical protein